MSEKRVSQPVNRYEECQSSNNSWTEDEKRELLKGLKKYGHKDIQSIAKILPNKPPAVIRNMINNLMLAAKRSAKPSPLPPIDMWLEQATKDETNALIPQALLFISLFERQPAPEDCGGCDLRAAYDYVYRMTQGHQAIGLTKKTRKMIYRVISKTASKVRIKSAENLLQLINNLYKSTPRKDYTRKSHVPKPVGPSTLLRELNTFMVASDQLRIT